MSTLTVISDTLYDKSTKEFYANGKFFDIMADSSKWLVIPNCGNVLDALAEVFPKMPEGGRLYLNYVSQDHDVTPTDLDGIERLQNMEGNFFLVVYPEGPAALIIAIVVAVVAIAAIFLFRPAVPNPALRNNQVGGSSNNELSQRTNTARPKGRIPDIFGQVNSTPDLICAPWLRFVNNQEVEDNVMCIGRGSYAIHSARDGETQLQEVPGSSLQIYRPHTDINSGTPYFTIGSRIPDIAMDVRRSNSVNGQELKPPNSGSMRGDNNVRIESPNTIRFSGVNPADIFEVGDTVAIQKAWVYDNTVYTTPLAANGPTSFVIPYVSDAQVLFYSQAYNVVLPKDVWIQSSNYGRSQLGGTFRVAGAAKITMLNTTYCQVTLQNPESVNPRWSLIEPLGYFQQLSTTVSHTLQMINNSLYFDGTYTIHTIGGDYISLRDPAAVNSNWNNLLLIGGASPWMSPNLTVSGSKWIGPFILEFDTRSHISLNFVATSGMYKDNGRVQESTSVAIEVEVTPVNSNNVATGAAVVYKLTITGSATDKNSKAHTLYRQTATVGRIMVRARRITPEDKDYEGSVVDTVKWKDLYSVGPLRSANFGDVTMVRLRQHATDGALALKERKLNCLVTRELPRRVSGSTFTKELFATKNAADIISFLCLDPLIGNRSKSEIDFENIYTTIGDVIDYFGTPLAAEFSYTFDSIDLNFEETISMVASAAFCLAYRRGSVIKLFFEKLTDKSTLLFNHRNKVPGTEIRTFTAGWQNDNDGVEYEYVDPANNEDAAVSLYIPTNRSAINAKKYESVGIRSRTQAHFHAWRLYNKLRYQFLSCEFTATQESFLLLLGDRILCANNTKGSTQNGEITAQNGLNVSTTQDLFFESGKNYYCFLQLSDGTIEVIQARQGFGKRDMVLVAAPRLPLVVDIDNYTRTTFLLAEGVSKETDAFLVVDLNFADNFTAKISAINYDDRYYANDKDYTLGRVSG